MTRRQTELVADTLHELAIAAVIGAGGDLVLNGTHIGVDLGGGLLGALFFSGSYMLTGLLGGSKV